MFNELLWNDLKKYYVYSYENLLYILSVLTLFFIDQNFEAEVIEALNFQVHNVSKIYAHQV
jgi:hypothetical protein